MSNGSVACSRNTHSKCQYIECGDTERTPPRNVPSNNPERNCTPEAQITRLIHDPKAEYPCHQSYLNQSKQVLTFLHPSSPHKTTGVAADMGAVLRRIISMELTELLETIYFKFNAICSVSPASCVHTINYPMSMLSTSDMGFVYGTPSERSYFSPVTPMPGNMFIGMSVHKPSVDLVYVPTTFGGFLSPNPSDMSSGRLGSGVTSLRQIGGLLTLTPEDIHCHMMLQNGGGPKGWHQSMDEVF
ncbi:hypothetical protein DFH08DRAFT_811309 [Mycena albidolilacea]|uniref:Uncharacterized protein n=1 Tax=Mycena albidolilacea TaxID=1033008 RepID=A0AAD6ZWJ1_9AGAR|nr:hypothetical protein DFH08DRAFT_811309 [Mycena albidolilacea]